MIVEHGFISSFACMIRNDAVRFEWHPTTPKRKDKKMSKAQILQFIEELEVWRGKYRRDRLSYAECYVHGTIMGLKIALGQTISAEEELAKLQEV